MKRCLRLLSAVPIAAAIAVLPNVASGQALNPFSSMPETGTFDRTHPEAARLLEQVERSRTALRDRLTAASAGQLSDADRSALLAALGGGAVPGAGASGLTELEVVLSRGRELERAILDVYATEGVADPYTRVEQIVDEYLRLPEPTLPAEPLALDVFEVVEPAMPAGGHGGHDMHAMHGAGGMAADDSFTGQYPDLARLLRAQQWLELALFEPVLLLRGAEEAEGVAEVISRYEERRDEDPGTRLSALPTPAAIAPELTMRHPRAAVILNHLHMLENATLDLLASDGSAPVAVEQLVADVTSTGNPTITQYQWLLLTLRRGIYAQGGPALGTLDRVDRNVGSPGDHRVQTGIIH